VKTRLAAICCAAVAVALSAWPHSGLAATPAPLSRVLPPALRTQVGKPLPPAPLFRSRFGLEASGGYRVSVTTYGSALILIVKHNGHGHDFTESVYLARGVATPNRLQATFGRLGKLSMRFRPSAEGEHERRRTCRGGLRLAQRRGAFVGSFRFRGEDGYVQVHAHRATGSTLRVLGRCHRRHPHLLRTKSSPLTPEETSTPFASQPPTGVIAIKREGVQLTAFLAFSRHRRASFFALREETRGHLAIARIAVARKRTELHVDEAATAMRVRPPAPFRRTGAYRAAPDGTTTWTGGLAVNFPGAPRFPLAGAGFEAMLEAPF
jgi:hypothetical protein